MLYLGHFSFERLERHRRSSEAWHGYFTCVVEAARRFWNQSGSLRDPEPVPHTMKPLSTLR